MKNNAIIRLKGDTEINDTEQLQAPVVSTERTNQMKQTTTVMNFKKIFGAS